MAGRGRRGIAAGLALLFGRQVAKRRRRRPAPAPSQTEADRLRSELREELAKREAKG